MEQDTRIIPVRLENGAIAHIEVVDQGGRAEVSDETAPRFREATTVIKDVSREIWETLVELRPQRFEVELGFEIGVESGKLTALLVKGSGKANLKVTLEWKAKE